MIIKEFKFNKKTYTKKYTTINLEKNKHFGLIYLTYYIRYAVEHLFKKNNYLKVQKASEFPNIIHNLTYIELKLGIEKLAKNKRISKEILFLNKPYIFDFKVL